MKLIEDRSENMHGGDFHGPDRIFDVELAYTDDGEFTHIRIDVLDDEGAYPGRSPAAACQTDRRHRRAVPASPAPQYNATAVATNKTGQVAVRGFGQSPTNYAIESAVDAAARELGMDRMEIRRRNFIQPDEFPYRIPSGTEYDSGDYPAVLDKAVARRRPAEPAAAARRAAGERAGWPGSGWPAASSPAAATPSSRTS